MSPIRLLGLAFLLSVPAAIAAQRPPDVLPPPDDSVYALAVDPGAYPGEDYVLLLEDGRLHVESDGRTSYSYRQVAQVLTNDGAASLGNLSIAYYPTKQRMTVNWMRVVRNGVVVQDGPEHQQETSPSAGQQSPVYSDQRVLQATLAGVVPGAIVDLSYTLETFQPTLERDVLYRWVFNELVPVRRSRFVLDAPADLPLRIRELNLADSALQRNDGERRISTWYVEDEPAVALQSFAGFPNDVVKRVTVSGPLAWRDIGVYYTDLVGDPYELDGEILAELAAHVQGSRSLRDSLDAVFRWVAQDFRYVSLSLGDGGYRPRVPREVYRTHFGDCKDKTTFFVALTRAMGVEAFPVLVHASGGIDSTMPSLKQFDHMIAAVALDGGMEFADLTWELVRFGEVPFDLQGEAGLLIRDDGRTDVVALPVRPPSDNRLDREVIGTVRSDGTFVGAITLSASGWEEPELREWFIDVGKWDEVDRQDVLRQIAGLAWSTAVVDSSHVFEGRDLTADPRATVWFTAKGAAGRLGDRLIMYPPLRDFSDASIVANLEAEGERRFPIDVAQVSSPSIHRSDVDIELPEGWKVDVPEAVSVDGPFGYYRAAFRQVGRHFRASREIGGLRGLLPPDSIGALLSWLRGVDTDDAEYVGITASDVASIATADAGLQGSLPLVLPTVEDFGPGATLTEEGSADPSNMLNVSFQLPLRTFARAFTAAQMVFPLGASQLVTLQIQGAEYASREDAGGAIRMLELLDFRSFFEAFFAQAGAEQMSVGEVRRLELPRSEGRAEGRIMTILTPVASFNMAFVQLARGRVAATVIAVGAIGMRDEDVDSLASLIVERIGTVEAFEQDVDPAEAGAVDTLAVDEQEVTEVTGGIPLGRMLPLAADFTAAVRVEDEFEHGDGAPSYTRTISGPAFVFPLGKSSLLALLLTLTLEETEAEALRQVRRQGPQSGSGFLSGSLEEEGPVLRMLFGDDLHVEPVDMPALGAVASAGIVRMRAGMRMDAAFASFSVGRVWASLVAIALPDSLDPADLWPIAEDVHRRIVSVAPELMEGTGDAQLIEVVDRVVAAEAAVDSLVDARAFDRAFAAVEAADLASAPVTFEASTWNSLCWYASLYGYAEQAMSACEKAVAPDTTNVSYRDSRALARALVGDAAGAIADFQYVVDHAAEGEFLDTRARWLDALLAGKSPFTEEVLAGLREP